MNGRQSFRVLSRDIAPADSHLYLDFNVVVSTRYNAYEVEKALAIIFYGPQLIGLSWLDIAPSDVAFVGHAFSADWNDGGIEELIVIKKGMMRQSHRIKFVLVFLPDDANCRGDLYDISKTIDSLFSDSENQEVFFTAALHHYHRRIVMFCLWVPVTMTDTPFG